MTDIYAVFNELAVAPAYRQQTWTKYDANQWLEQFSHLLYQAERNNIAGLRTYSHSHEIELIVGYSLQEWFNDQHFNADVRLRLQTIFTSLSRLQAFPENQQGDPLLEYHFNGSPAYGLGAAHLLDSIAISLATSNQMWQGHLLILAIAEMQESGELVENTDAVRHMSTEAHLLTHGAWISERLKTSVQNGRALWRKTQEWYPHLIFCRDAETQLKQLAGGTPQFRRVIARLFELEYYCQQWLDGGFDGQRIPHSSGESDSTMQQYGHLREFMCPDGEKRSFEYHLKGLPDYWRIHIWPDERSIFKDRDDQTRKILIGYIGKHLLTTTG